MNEKISMNGKELTAVTIDEKNYELYLDELVNMSMVLTKEMYAIADIDLPDYDDMFKQYREITENDIIKNKNNPAQFIIFMVNGENIGYTLHRKNLFYKETFSISELFLKKRFRSKGYGKIILRHTLDVLKSKCKYVDVTVLTKNSKAINMYIAEKFLTYRITLAAKVKKGFFSLPNILSFRKEGLDFLKRSDVKDRVKNAYVKKNSSKLFKNKLSEKAANEKFEELLKRFEEQEDTYILSIVKGEEIIGFCAIYIRGDSKLAEIDFIDMVVEDKNYYYYLNVLIDGLFDFLRNEFKNCEKVFFTASTREIDKLHFFKRKKFEEFERGLVKIF